MTTLLDSPPATEVAPSKVEVATATVGQTVHRYQWIAFTGVIASTVMDLLDSTVINVAAPAIRQSLGGSYSSLQWMAASYTLAMAIALLTGGRLGDVYGRRRMLSIGVGGFVIASVACAAAQTPAMMIGSRAVQGLFGAIMLPQCFGLIRDLFAPKDLKKAWGVFGPIMGLSAVMGPIVGGLLIKADIAGTGWRSIFLINVPVGAYALFVARKYLPATPPAATDRGFDLRGILLAAAGTTMLVFPLVQGRELGWPLWSLGMLVGSVPVFVLFARHQLARKRSGVSPLVEPSLFGKRKFVAGVVFTTTFMGALGGMVLTLGLFLQLGLGYSPIRAALAMSPWAVGGVIGSIISSGLMHTLGRRILHIGLAAMGAGLVALVGVLHFAGTDVNTWKLAVPTLLGGIGMGAIFVPLLDVVLGGVEDHEVGSASSVLTSINQLGMSLGIAVLGTVYFEVLGAIPSAAASVRAAQWCAAGTVGLVALTFLVGFALPKKARVSDGVAH